MGIKSMERYVGMRMRMGGTRNHDISALALEIENSSTNRMPGWKAIWSSSTAVYSRVEHRTSTSDSS
jgi:hypothetical protein